MRPLCPQLHPEAGPLGRDRRSGLLPTQPFTEITTVLFTAPSPAPAPCGQGLRSIHPGEAQPAGWPRESRASLLSQQLSQRSISTGLAQIPAQNRVRLEAPTSINFAL